jgi:hypothetical protein
MGGGCARDRNGQLLPWHASQVAWRTIRIFSVAAISRDNHVTRSLCIMVLKSVKLIG